MTRARRILLAALALIALAAAGCGGDDEGAPIPASTASALQSELDNIQGRLDNGSAGACRDILEGSRGPNMERVQELIDAMPDDVDADVRSAMEDSFDRLWELVQQDCDEKAEQEEESTPEPEPEPTPTETETTPPETVPPETETIPPAEEELPPDGDGDTGGVPGNGNGNGNGTGNGGGVGPGGADQEEAR